MANLKLRSTTSATDPGSTSAKGSALTHTEMDSNFILLNNEKANSASPTITGTATIDNNGILQFNEATANGSNYVQIKSLASIAANYTLTLPPNDGASGEVLTTDGSGVLTWTSKTSSTPTQSQSGSNFTLSSASNLDTNNNEIIDSNASSIGVRFGSDINLNGQSIVTASNGHITIDPNGTGQVRLGTAEAEQYAGGNGGLIIHDQSQGNHTDIPAAGANYGAIYGTGIQVENTGGAGTPLLLWSNKTNTGYPNLWAHRSRDDGAGNRDFLDNDDIVFTFFAAGWDGSTTEASGFGTFTQTAAVEMKAAEDHSGSAQGGKIVFKTINNASTTSSTKLTLDDNIEANVPFVLKHYTTTERNALTAVEGSIIYNSTDNKAQVYNGTSWDNLN